jgi:hypothetical protein
MHEYCQKIPTFRVGVGRNSTDACVVFFWARAYTEFPAFRVGVNPLFDTMVLRMTGKGEFVEKRSAPIEVLSGHRWVQTEFGIAGGRVLRHDLSDRSS